jgi:hypothetical protein
MLTAYDTHGKIVDSVGIDVLSLVGDSASSCRVMAGLRNDFTDYF